MTVFLVLQVFFDAALLFGFLFLFHYATQKVQNRREDEAVLKNLESQELRSGLQELLVTLRQVGGDVSGDLQAKVRDAEAAGEKIGKQLEELGKNLKSLEKTAEAVLAEKEHLESKAQALQAARKKSSKSSGGVSTPESLLTAEEEMEFAEEDAEPSNAVGFSTKAVKEIYRLADKDLNVTEIARKTHLTRGEVQLILNLRGNRFSTPN